MTMRRERGFIPGMVVEINIAIAVLLVALAVLVPASSSKFKPMPIDPKAADLVVPVSAAMSAEWGVPLSMDTTGVVKTESFWTMWIVAVLFLATVICIFVAALHWPYWLALALLCGTWWYGLESNPGHQAVRIGKDGSVKLAGMVRFAAPMGGAEQLNVKEIETVLVHKEQPVAYLVFQRNKQRLGWRIYAGSQAEAQAVATLIRSQLRPEAEVPAPGRDGSPPPGTPGKGV